MRAMVGGLRDRRSFPSLAPRHRLADIEGLAASGTNSLRVEVELRGDLADLAPSLEAALYRVAQESVTNVRRHAHGATRVAVTVTGNAADVQLTVSDDGARTTTSDPPGYGLVGMAERVTLLGGTLTAGPGSGRGWLVRVVLPAPPERDMTVRVLIADDQSIVRAGLATILNDQPDIEVVGQAADGRDGVALARRLRPDVCLFDIRMPYLDGIEATRLLAGPDAEDPIAVVVITRFDADEDVHGALKAGARGFLLKGASPDQLVQAIHAAVNGDALIDPGVTARLLARFARSTSAVPLQPLEPLTHREEAVLLTVARGSTNAEIGQELHISLSTVKFHLASLMTKLGARNRVELAIWAYETGRVN